MSMDGGAHRAGFGSPSVLFRTWEPFPNVKIAFGDPNCLGRHAGVRPVGTGRLWILAHVESERSMGLGSPHAMDCMRGLLRQCGVRLGRSTRR